MGDLTDTISPSVSGKSGASGNGTKSSSMAEDK